MDSPKTNYSVLGALGHAMVRCRAGSTRQIKDKTRPEDTSVKSEPPSQQESIKMRIPLIFGVFSSLGLCQSFSLSETTQGIHILY